MKLTRMFDERSEQGMVSTPPGMAHWKGSGPRDKTCRECEHYELDKTSSGHIKRNVVGELKQGRCLKYKQLIGRSSAWPRLKHSLPACKYFEAAERPVAAFEGGK